MSDSDDSIYNERPTQLTPSGTEKALAKIRRYQERLKSQKHTIHHLPEQPNEMALPEQTGLRDLNELKFRLSAINHYDGNPEGLNNYIFSCRQVTNNYNEQNISGNDRALIIAQLKSKLQDRASLQLGTRNYNSYENYYEDSRQSFSLGKDLNSYRSDILNAHKRSNQPILEFAYDIRRLLDLSYDFVQSTTYPLAEMATIKRELDCIAIEKIIGACHHDLQRHFFSLQPNNIADVIKEIQRDMAFTQRTRQNGSSYNSYREPPRHDYRPTRPPPPAPSQFQRNYIPHTSHAQPQSRPPHLPPKPQANIPMRQNNPPPSGRYANDNVFRNGNHNYPRPPAFNNNFNNQSRLQKNTFNHQTRPPYNGYNNNNPGFRFPPYNGYNNNYPGFNRPPPPRPVTQHPPTPMEINAHDYQDSYYDYQDYYPYDGYDQQYDYEPYGDDFHEPQDYYTENFNTQYISDEFSSMQIKNDNSPTENVNFTTPASDTPSNPKTH